MILAKIGAKIAQNTSKNLAVGSQLTQNLTSGMNTTLNMNMSMLNTYSLMGTQMFRTFNKNDHASQKFFFMKKKGDFNKGKQPPYTIV